MLELVKADELGLSQNGKNYYFPLTNIFFRF